MLSDAGMTLAAVKQCQGMEYHTVYRSFSYCVLFSIMFLGYNKRAVIGMLTLSPMMVAPVCRVGDPLQLTCTAPVEFLRWSILRVNEQGTLERITNDVKVNSRDDSQMVQTRVNSTTITFTRTSAQGASPLTSTLSVDSISTDLNGKVVCCIDVANPMISASTTIQIIDSYQSIPTPILSISEEYSTDNVTVNVTVGWAQQASVRYYANVVPLVPIVSTETAIYQLTISYNTKYNFSIVATTPCRPNATSFITLKYANCGHPELLFTTSNDSDYRQSAPKVVGYDDLPIEGSTITVSCPPGLELIGSNSSTCAENGEWKPDPRGLLCNDTDPEGTTKCSIITSRTLIIIRISASVAAIILCITVITVLVAAVILHRKGFGNKKPHTELSARCSVQGGQISVKYLDHNQGQVHPDHEPEGLIYADVAIASKHKTKGKRTMVPARDQTHDLDVQYSKINHDLIVGDDKHKVQVTENNNDTVTLDKLVILLWEQVGPKWREFGETVGIDEMVMDSIASTCSPENYFSELLDYWLQYYDGRPTWSDVTDALYSIDLQKLAQDIEQVYKTGDIYVNVTNTMPAVKPSTQSVSSQLPAMRQDSTPFDSYNESNSDKHLTHKSPNFPPPVASKPKIGIH